MSETKVQKLTLVANDGNKIEVGKTPPPCYAAHKEPPLTAQPDRIVAEKSVLIKNMLDDLGDEQMTAEVPIPNVSPRTPLPHRSASPPTSNILLTRCAYRLMTPS
jgi:S-phase kinase-associated protein 1